MRINHICCLTNLSESTIRRYVKGLPVADRTARRIETKLGLESGSVTRLSPQPTNKGRKYKKEPIIIKEIDFITEARERSLQRARDRRFEE
jgi:hypothetical protein